LTSQPLVLTMEVRKESHILEIPITAKAALLHALLVDGPGYGTELTERIETRTGGGVKLLQGSIYPALEKFVQADLVRSYSAANGGGRARVYYALTPRGKALAEEQQAMMLGLFSSKLTPKKQLAETKAANLAASMERRKAAHAA
jgi:PadR family transcriptional regulator, regulatory protein PadR